MSKTPFELRMELLSMAKDLLVDEYHSKNSFVKDQWHRQLEIDRSVPAPTGIKYPSEDDVIAKAKKLNAFISNEI